MFLLIHQSQQFDFVEIESKIVATGRERSDNQY
jgi:hypothetical protein